MTRLDFQEITLRPAGPKVFRFSPSKSISISEKHGKLGASEKKFGCIGNPRSHNVKLCMNMVGYHECQNVNLNSIPKIP